MGPIVIDLDPTIIRVGHFALRWYGLFIALAILVAFSVALKEARRKGIDEDHVWGIGTWAIVGGFAGARLLHVIDRWPEYAADPGAIFAIQNGGLAIYGAVLGGTAAGALAAARRGLLIARIADVAAPAIILGQAIGRIGCIFNGDALGSPTNLPWGFAYVNPGAMVPELGVAYQPTPVYELVGDLLIFAVLWRLRTRLKTEGALFLTYLLLYSSLKFAVSFARQEVVFFAGLQEAQLFSAAGALVAVGMLLWLRRRRSALAAVLPARASSRSRRG